MLLALNTGEYDGCDCISFSSTSRALVKTDSPMDWSLDGEKAEGASEVEITNLPGAVNVILPEK